MGRTAHEGKRAVRVLARERRGLHAERSNGNFTQLAPRERQSNHEDSFADVASLPVC
jgi:hypothetical protein